MYKYTIYLYVEDAINMKLSIIFSVFLIGPCLSYGSEGSHHNHGNSASHTTTKANLKFKADKILSENMKAIESLVNNETKNVTGKVIKNGAEIRKRVDDIFKSCKLDSEADSALHPILAKILKGADLLDQRDASGNTIIQNAIKQFHESFEKVLPSLE